ncbi:MAG TPA: GNAT family N-acetyltransferase [Chitinophagaceae bacterium]|nr:GNAT family N-acetyltransferase [Chitinophagaceae bacterium]HMZ46582.1 GNAT family N-acetyltransferase [Chitinophagaceae bacterium]HNF30634.1 GNAT family N-acetyltransferase [Chitinophagaceae bacterium]HNJ59231.1 GNAT family N-acetyltransferase [Chitinophagaceae bacterium]HNL82572.1 GNAT family N-acetyltransferase [Chitinophagaceae bacterium]
MLQIRNAVENDIVAIQTIAKATWLKTYMQILSSEQMSYMLNWMYSFEILKNQMQNNHAFFVGYLSQKQHEILGFAAISREAEKLFKLQKLYILPEQQKIGLGKLLLQKVCNHAKENGANTLQLQVNRNNIAVNFYKKHGFKIIAEEDFDIGNGYFMNDYVMELQFF